MGNNCRRFGSHRFSGRSFWLARTGEITVKATRHFVWFDTGSRAAVATLALLGLLLLPALARADVTYRLEPIAADLDVPWGMVQLPNGDLLITERDGRLLRLTDGGAGARSEIDGVPEVDDGGQGGLLDIALQVIRGLVVAAARRQSAVDDCKATRWSSGKTCSLPISVAAVGGISAAVSHLMKRDICS